jgi:hypothetical protein
VGLLGPLASDIVARLAPVAEQLGEPSPLLGGQAFHEAGEGVGVQLSLVFSATRSATTGRRWNNCRGANDLRC